MLRVLAGCTLAGVSLTTVCQSLSKPLVVPLVGSNGPVGEATFRQTMLGTLNIDIVVHALTRGEHAVHIHTENVCDAPDFHTAGPHFNPSGRQHGWHNPAGHHAGDLSENLTVDADGEGHMNVTSPVLSLRPDSPNFVRGHSIVVHERADDGRSDPGGKSGNRIACGIIPVTPERP